VAKTWPKHGKNVAKTCHVRRAASRPARQSVHAKSTIFGTFFSHFFWPETGDKTREKNVNKNVAKTLQKRGKSVAKTWQKREKARCGHEK